MGKARSGRRSGSRRVPLVVASALAVATTLTVLVWLPVVACATTIRGPHEIVDGGGVDRVDVTVVGDTVVWIEEPQGSDGDGRVMSHDLAMGETAPLTEVAGDPWLLDGSGGTAVWTEGLAEAEATVWMWTSRTQGVVDVGSHFGAGVGTVADGNLLAWPTSDGIIVLDWTTGERYEFGEGEISLVSLGDGRVAWGQVEYLPADDLVVRLYTAHVEEGTTVPVRGPDDTSAFFLSTGGGHVAWIDEDATYSQHVYVYDTETGETALIDERSEEKPGNLEGIEITGSKLAYSASGPGDGHLRDMIVTDVESGEAWNFTEDEWGTVQYFDIEGDTLAYVFSRSLDWSLRYAALETEGESDATTAIGDDQAPRDRVVPLAEVIGPSIAIAGEDAGLSGSGDTADDALDVAAAEPDASGDDTGVLRLALLGLGAFVVTGLALGTWRLRKVRGAA